jgi:hypothetical protein
MRLVHPPLSVERAIILISIHMFVKIECRRRSHRSSRYVLALGEAGLLVALFDEDGGNACESLE